MTTVPGFLPAPIFQPTNLPLPSSPPPPPPSPTAPPKTQPQLYRPRLSPIIATATAASLFVVVSLLWFLTANRPQLTPPVVVQVTAPIAVPPQQPPQPAPPPTVPARPEPPPAPAAKPKQPAIPAWTTQASFSSRDACHAARHAVCIAITNASGQVSYEPRSALPANTDGVTHLIGSRYHTTFAYYREADCRREHAPKTCSRSPLAVQPLYTPDEPVQRPVVTQPAVPPPPVYVPRRRLPEAEPRPIRRVCHTNGILTVCGWE